MTAEELLDEALARYGAMSDIELGTEEMVVSLHRNLARLQHVVSRASGALERSGACQTNGARSTANFISQRCAISPTSASRELRRSKLCAEHEVVGRAFHAGMLSADHLDAIARIERTSTAEAITQAEELIVEQARHLSFSAFIRMLAYLDQVADPDGADDKAAHDRERRDVHLAPGFSGSYIGQITLDPISGEIVATELGRLERELFAADWTRAKAELGREPKAAELSRSSAQRRADALVEMATRSRSTPADAARPAPLFTVVVDHPTFAGRLIELASRTVVAPGALVPWLDNALVERVVFTTPRRADVGVRTRLFSGATRRAIEVRDLECSVPGCDVPAARCECDHIVPYAQGGETTQENGRMLCGFHNRLRNHQQLPGDPSSSPSQSSPPPEDLDESSAIGHLQPGAGRATDCTCIAEVSREPHSPAPALDLEGRSWKRDGPPTTSAQEETRDVADECFGPSSKQESA